MIRKLLLVVFVLILSACGSDGDTDSGSSADATLPGTNVPVSFVGVYQGTLNLTASALGASISDTFPITITVNDDSTVRFDGDDPDETFTVGLQDDGVFQGNLSIDQDQCVGSLVVNGQVDGTTVTGDVSGTGSCDVDGVNADVDLTGDFNATR